MARRDTSPDFIEALARGLDVIRVFQPRQPVMSLAAVAGASGLARPTVRRILLTLEQLGYVRAADGGFELTPRVLELGMAYVRSRNLWEVARPHMEGLVAQTHESSSIAQLDGSDIVYVARVAVPKIIALAVTIGTRPGHADITRQGAAGRPPTRRGRAGAGRAQPVRHHRQVAAGGGGPCRRAAGGAGPGLVAHRRAARGGDPLGGGPAARWEQVIAAMNVTVHRETSVETLTGEYLPLLLTAAGAVGADWAAYQSVPQITVPPAARPAVSA